MIIFLSFFGIKKIEIVFLRILTGWPAIINELKLNSQSLYLSWANYFYRLIDWHFVSATGCEKYESYTSTYSHFCCSVVYDVIHAKEKKFFFILSLICARKRIFLSIDNVHEWQDDKMRVYVCLLRSICECVWLVSFPSLFPKYLCCLLTIYY